MPRNSFDRQAVLLIVLVGGALYLTGDVRRASTLHSYFFLIAAEMSRRLPAGASPTVNARFHFGW